MHRIIKKAGHRIEKKELEDVQILLILAFVCTNGAHALYEKSKINTRENLGIEDAEYRREFCSPGMKEDRDEWSDSCLSFLEK